MYRVIKSNKQLMDPTLHIQILCEAFYGRKKLITAIVFVLENPVNLSNAFHIMIDN